METIEWFELPDLVASARPEAKPACIGRISQLFGEHVGSERAIAQGFFKVALAALAKKHGPRFTKYLQAYGPNFEQDFIDIYISRVRTVAKTSPFHLTEEQFVYWVEEQFLGGLRLVGWNAYVVEQDEDEAW